MDAQTKKEIIAEITATAVKTVEQTIRESLKRVLPEDFVDKTTDAAVKRIKRSTVPEFKNKENKIRYEANNSVMEEIDEAISAIEKGEIERCQEKLAEGKKVVLKQQKLLRIADREEDGWEVVKCYFSDNLASDSEDEKQLSRAHREAAASKKKREANKQIDKKQQFRNTPFSEKIPKPLANHTKDAVALGITQKICFACEQEGHFQYFCPNKRY